MDFDPISLLLSQDPQALAKAQAAALRGQAYTGAALGLAHEPGAQKVGAQFAQQAEQGQQQLGQGAGQVLQKLLHGPQGALGGLTPDAYAAITHRLSVPKFGVNQVTGALYNQRTGEAGPGGASAGAGYDKRLDPMMKSLRDDLDSSISRGGVMKGNQERLNAAQRLLTLAVDPLTGGPANLTPQQMSEVSTSLATLIGGGGSSEGSRHELTPYTHGRSMAEVMQWLSDKPQGAGQQAFVKQMIDTARREQGTAENAIRSAQAQRLPLHGQLFQLFPEQAQNALSGYGFEPGSVDLKTGKYTPKPKAPPAAASPAGAAAVHPQADEALKWAKANPTDPRAVAIMQKLGATP